VNDQQPAPMPAFASDPAAVLAAGLAGVVLVAISAGGPSWLDSAELIAAARELGGIHPPGHPAWLSLAGLAEWLPIGAYSARVVWLSAIFGALAVALTVRLARRAMGPFGTTTAGSWWAFGAGVAVASSGSMWLFGGRAEVYTLALASNLWAIDAALRAGDAAERGDLRPGPVVETAVAVAVGLLNHHYITLFALPAVAVAGWPALMSLGRGRPRVLLTAVAVAAFAGLAYLAPSLRSLADTEMQWGDPATPLGFWQGITAAHFQRSVTESNVAIGDNLLVLFGALAARTGPIVAAVGFVGLGLGGLQRRRAWLAVAVAALGALATKALMAINTGNPDDYGYTALAAAALGIGIASFGAMVFGAEGPLRRLAASRRRRLSFFVLPWLLLMCALQAFGQWYDPDVNLAGMRSPDIVDGHMRRVFSPGALYLSNQPFLAFNEQAFRIAEGRRPDLTASHLSFRTGDTDGGKRFARWLSKRRPEVGGLARVSVRLKTPAIGNLLPLVNRWDVFAERDADIRIPPSVYGFDAFANRLLRQPERAVDYTDAQAAERHQRIWSALYERLERLGPIDRQTREVLVWQHAIEAAGALRMGRVETARGELELAQKLAPRDATLRVLQWRLNALEDRHRSGDSRGYRALWARYNRMPLDALTSPDLP